MAAKTKVIVVDASGETGGSIVNALLATPDKFDIAALARSSSLEKPVFVSFKNRGVTIKPVDLDGPLEAITPLLVGADVVISGLTLIPMAQEIAPIKAAAEAKVGRFVPSFFAPCIAPRGVMFAREKKEELLDLLKKHRVPYTAIDVGWWHQLSLPSLPSGRIPAEPVASLTKIIGTRDTAMALTDNRDIGRYVARIIVDPRTLNKYVFAYGAVWTQNKVIETLERLSGEIIQKEYLLKEHLEKEMADAEEALAKGNEYENSMMILGMAQYFYAMGIRGDNTPEYAKYLGYLDVKELYPDLKTHTLEKYIEDRVSGKLKGPYGGSRKNKI